MNIEKIIYMLFSFLVATPLSSNHMPKHECMSQKGVEERIKEANDAVSSYLGFLIICCENSFHLPKGDREGYRYELVVLRDKFKRINVSSDIVSTLENFEKLTQEINDWARFRSEKLQLKRYEIQQSNSDVFTKIKSAKDCQIIYQLFKALEEHANHHHGTKSCGYRHNK